MKISIQVKQKPFADFDNNLNLLERIALAYAVIRNFNVFFNFEEIRILEDSKKK